MDILLFAIVACFLLWKLRSAINKEPTFLKNNTNSNDSTPQKKVTLLQNVKVFNVQKPQKKNAQSEVTSIFEEEKNNIDASLHQGYASLLAVNSQLRVNVIQADVSDIYEEIFSCFQTKMLIFTKFFVEKPLYELLKEKIENPQLHIFLCKIDAVEIKQIKTAGKVVDITVEVASQQIVYQEDAEGNIIKGSKAVPVSVRESLELSLLPNTSAWRLNRIF